jgi:multiple sugar transport system ATP-binding protein
MASAAFRGVSKVFDGGVRALSDLDLEAGEGEFLVLVGPSGCGKSTALRILGGLETPTTGRVFIGGRDVTDVEPRDRDVAMVFQNYALYPHMSVMDNMAFSLKMRKVPGEEIRSRVSQAASVLGIGDLLSRKPRELSGGQRQRVAVGRAIVRKPAVFLFDEPLSNLDARLRVQMRGELGILHERLGSTMIYVTHDQVEAMTLGQRILVLRDGIVQQIAPPMELYLRPANVFVAGFIGSPSMNIFDVTVTGGRAALEGGQVVADGIGAPDGRYRLGIRPEHIVAGGGLAAIVRMVETLGNEKILHLDLCGIPAVMRAEPSVEASPGQPFGVAFERPGIHLFREDGTRMVIDV